MPRITPEERARFHAILDKSIDKMNRPKNAEKQHWSNQPTIGLLKHLREENHELVKAFFYESDEAIIDECYDNINLPLMIIDNLQGNK